MKLKEFLNSNKRKILICDSVSVANKLFRRLNIQNDLPIVDAKCITVKEIAKEIYYSYIAYNGEQQIRYLEDAEGTVMLVNHFDDKMYSFVPQECLNMETFSMIYNSINQIRTGKLIKEDTEDIHNLLDLIDGYEEYIESEDCIDSPLLLKRVNKILDDNDSIKYLEFNKDTVFGLLNGTKLTHLEQSILDKIVRLLNTEYGSIEYLEEHSLNESFTKTYGSFNEVKYAIEEIKKNKYKYGEVEILYTTYEYENYLRAILEEEKIAFRMVGNTHASSTNFITYLLDLCNFIQNNYKYCDLQKVVNNPIATLPDSDINIVKAFNVFANESAVEQKDRYILMANRIRNNEFEHIRDTEKYKEYASFLIALTEIVKEDDDNAKTFSNLIEFAIRYTKKKNPEIHYLMPHFDMIARLLDLRYRLDKETLLKNIIERLENLTYKEVEDSGSINCRYFGSINVIDRKHLFVLGLSANALLQKEIESAIFEDDKIDEYLENINDSLVLGCNANKDYIDRLNRTIDSMNNGDIHYIYNYYNTVDLIEESPSVFYLDKKQENSEITYTFNPLNKDVVVKEETFLKSLGDDYEDDMVSNGSLKEIEYDYIYKHYDYNEDLRREIKKKINEEKKLEDNTLEKSISPSALATLANCPLQFYYQYIKYLDNVELKETDPSKWLDKAQTGTMFHRVMEIYMREEFFTAKKNALFNEELYQKAFDIALEEAKISMPIMNEKIYSKEVEDIDSKLRKTIGNTIDKFNDMNEKYQYFVIGTEVGFGKNSIKVVYNSIDGYTLSFNGSIDRLDGYLDENKILHISVVDYKTGKKENLEKKIKNHLTFQHIIYPLAGINYVKEHKEEIETRLGSKINKIMVASSSYYMVEDFAPIEGINDTLEYLTADNDFDYHLIDLPKNVTNILSFTERLRQDNRTIEVSAEIDQYFGSLEEYEPSNSFDKNNICMYCKYSKVCRKKLSGEGKGWKHISEK